MHMQRWKTFYTKTGDRFYKDDCFRELIDECIHLAPGSRLSYNLRNRLEKISKPERKELVSRMKNGCAPLFFACEKGQLEIVEYLVNVCDAQLEQTGMYEVLDDRSVHSVTPLWCAAVSGKLPIVKFLVERGANINAVSDTGSTPVRSACFMTHLEIVKYLVENGADINKPNYNGGTCLINSVQSVELCEFLLDNGAEVNAQDIQSKTALHYAIQEHRLGTTMLLVERGANLDAKSKYGDDALQTACLKGAISIFRYLTEHREYPANRLADANELMGSTFFDEHNDLSTTISYWRTAQQIRDTHNLYPKQPVIEPQRAYRHAVEFTSTEELDNILTDIDAVRMQSLLIIERILGRFHKDAVFRLMFRGAAYADMLHYQRCIDLWRKALEIRVEKDTILYSDTCFTAQALVRFMVDYNEAGEAITSKQRYEDALAIFDLLTQDIEEMRNLLLLRPQSRRQVENFDKILKCITHLIYLLLENSRSNDEKKVVYNLTRQLVWLNPRSVLNGDSLLHICISKLYNSRNAAYEEDDLVRNPKQQLVTFLLESGVDVNARNENKATPLHLATQSANHNSWLVPLLLDYGAHIDMPNTSGEKPVDKVNHPPFNLNIKILDHVSLKCLCASVIAKNNVRYKGILPPTLVKFVDLHK